MANTRPELVSFSVITRLVWLNITDTALGCDATIDDLIDVLEARSRSYIPVIYVLNKIDAISIEELDLLYRIPNAVPISSEHGWNVDVSCPGSASC